MAHNQKIGPVDATNLPINALGIYNDPAFGKTTAHFATQLNLATLAPTIGANAVVDSVYLSVPLNQKPLSSLSLVFLLRNQNFKFIN